MRDPARYRPNALRYIEKFNMAIKHFRMNGHNWETSMIHTSMLSALKEINTPYAFHRWMFRTQECHRGLELAQIS